MHIFEEDHEKAWKNKQISGNSRAGVARLADGRIGVVIKQGTFPVVMSTEDATRFATSIVNAIEKAKNR